MTSSASEERLRPYASGVPGVVDISQSKVRHEDAGAALRQHTRGRSADAVVGAGDDGDVAGEVEEWHRNGSC